MRTLLNVFEDFFNRPWNYATRWISRVILKSFHSVCFTCACLPVSKKSCVVAFKYWLYSRFCSSIVYFLLGIIRSIDLVESKVVVCCKVRVVLKIKLTTIFCDFWSKVLLYDTPLRVYLDNWWELLWIRKFAFKRRSHTNNNFKIRIGIAFADIKWMRSLMAGCWLSFRKSLRVKRFLRWYCRRCLVKRLSLMLKSLTVRRVH